jgi:hypothetical protein
LESIDFKKIEEQFRTMSALPPAPSFVGKNANLVECACRKKNIDISEVKYHWTGICHASDSMCVECVKMVPKHALIVCIGCQAVVARIAPEKLKSGFVIKPRGIYHTDKCPNCHKTEDNSVMVSKILEAELFIKNL